MIGNWLKIGWKPKWSAKDYGTTCAWVVGFSAVVNVIQMTAGAYVSGSIDYVHAIMLLANMAVLWFSVAAYRKIEVWRGD